MLNVILRVSEEAAPRFGEAVFGIDKFIQEAAIGVVEIGIGTALAGGAVWFLMRGSGRIVRAWRKFRGSP